jgi:hypothetical protein
VTGDNESDDARSREEKGGRWREAEEIRRRAEQERQRQEEYRNRYPGQQHEDPAETQKWEQDKG